MATISITETMTLNVIHCASCHIPFAITEEHQQRLRRTHEGFYCPNGHSNIYDGLNTEEKLRAELKRKEQELANVAIEKIQLKNQITEKERQLKRIHKGVCPCCNRSFINLQRHMKTKHPELLNP